MVTKQLDISAAAAALGSKGGKSTSEAKQQASRENGKRGGRPRKETKMTAQNSAQKLDGKYITKQDVISAGGAWNDDWNVYVFPDRSCGAFTDIVSGGSERTSTGELILHFVGGDILPEDN